MDDLQNASVPASEGTIAPPASGEPVSTTGTPVSVEVDSQPDASMEAVAHVDVPDDDLAEAPAQSSPEQKGRWAKLRDKAERAERGVAERDQQLLEYAPIAPVREHAVSLVESLMAETPDVTRGIDALAAIDQVGANALAAELVRQYGNDWLKHEVGLTLEEIRASLERQQITPAQADVTGLDEAIETYLDPEHVALLRERLRVAEEYERQRQNFAQQRTEADLAAGLDQYNAQFDPIIEGEMARWKVDPASPDAQDFATLISSSIQRNPEDMAVLQNAQRAFVEGRAGLAMRQAEAIKRILAKHAALVGSRRFAEKQAAELAASQAAQARAAQASTPPEHVPGSVGTPSPGGVQAPETFGGLPKKVAEMFTAQGWRHDGKRWVK